MALLLLGSIVLFPIATRAGFWDQALEFGKNLLGTAAGNYTSTYQQDLSQLLQVLQQPKTANQPLLQRISQVILPGVPSPFANPVKPSQQYIIPENNNWLSLDQFKDIEAPIIQTGFHRSQRSSTPFIIGQGSSSPQAQDQGLIPTTYFTQKAGESLRVTRWFRHE